MPITPAVLGYRSYYNFGPTSARVLVYNPCVLKLISFNYLAEIGSAIRFWQLFDLNTLPTPGLASYMEIQVPPAGHGMYAPSMNGRPLLNGLAVALSSTPYLYTPTPEQFDVFSEWLWQKLTP